MRKKCMLHMCTHANVKLHLFWICMLYSKLKLLYCTTFLMQNDIVYMYILFLPVIIPECTGCSSLGT